MEVYLVMQYSRNHDNCDLNGPVACYADVVDAKTFANKLNNDSEVKEYYYYKVERISVRTH